MDRFGRGLCSSLRSQVDGWGWVGSPRFSQDWALFPPPVKEASLSEFEVRPNQLFTASNRLDLGAKKVEIQPIPEVQKQFRNKEAA